MAPNGAKYDEWKRTSNMLDLAGSSSGCLNEPFQIDRFDTMYPSVVNSRLFPLDYYFG